MKKNYRKSSLASFWANFGLCLGLCFVLFSCEEDKISPGVGTAVFYTTSNTNGRIDIAVSGNGITPSVFTVPVTNNPDSYCANGWTGYIVLGVGTYTYKATATNGKQWNGSIDITKDNCLQVKF